MLSFKKEQILHADENNHLKKKQYLQNKNKMTFTSIKLLTDQTMTCFQKPTLPLAKQ